MSEYSFKVSIAILFPLETVDFLSILVFINQHRKFVFALLLQPIYRPLRSEVKILVTKLALSFNSYLFCIVVFKNRSIT